MKRWVSDAFPRLGTYIDPSFSPVALPTTYSCVSAVALAVLTFAAMQVFRDELGTEGKMTILGGFVGSWFFIFLLTVGLCNNTLLR